MLDDVLDRLTRGQNFTINEPNDSTRVSRFRLDLLTREKLCRSTDGYAFETVCLILAPPPANWVEQGLTRPPVGPNKVLWVVWVLLFRQGVAPWSGIFLRWREDDRSLLPPREIYEPSWV